MWKNQIPWCLLTVACLYILNHFATPVTALSPPTPQIDKLTTDYISDTLEAKWYDRGSAFLDEVEATWEINILYKKPLENAAQETMQSIITGTDKLLYWTWTSKIPFNCTDHYVKIRCCVPKKEVCSKWSELEKIPGKGSGMYPIDRVALVGTKVTFCCVWKQEEQMTTIDYGGCKKGNCWNEPLSEQSMAIHADKVALSPSSGFNAWCLAQTTETSSESIYGTVLFVGYAPDVPKELNCAAQGAEEIMCEWSQERSTNLFGPRGTYYFLTERFSGKNITCIHATRDQQELDCNFPVIPDQTKYHFTVEAYNNLGYAKASVSFEID